MAQLVGLWHWQPSEVYALTLYELHDWAQMALEIEKEREQERDGDR